MRDPSMRPTPFQAYVRIMIGCDKFCTYCIVPSVRGPEQSRPPEHIAAEVRQLAAEGCKEITLLGQTVNSYQLRPRRRPAASGCPTCWLRIHDTPGIERIKFITNFPRDMSDDLLDAVRDLPKVCPYLHVPAQSGCNDVLKRMKRLYTVEYLPRHAGTAAGSGCRAWPISSDFIVGFCGETEESFQKTCDLVREAGFKNSFIFKYSPRPGTKADELYRRRRAGGSEEAAQQRPAGDPERRQPGRPPPPRRRHGRGAGRGAEQDGAEGERGRQPRCRPDAAHRPDDDGPHRRLRRQRTA